MSVTIIHEVGCGWQSFRWLISWPGGAIFSPSYGSEDACWDAIGEELGR